jgi:hypothetical protein
MLGAMQFLAPLLASIAALSATAHAQREVVVGDGASFLAALADATPGDTILVGPGRYTDPEALWYQGFNPARSGTADAPIVIRADPPLGATLVGETDVARCGSPEASGDCVAIGIFDREHVVVDGFRVEGMVKVQLSRNVTIQNCDVMYGSREGNDESLLWGIAIHEGDGSRGSVGNVIRSNRVHDMRGGNRSHNTAGIMLFGETSENVIEYNDVDAGPCEESCAVYSAFGQKGGNVHDNTWRCNVARNGTDAFHGMGSTDESRFSDDNLFYGNLILGSTNAFGCNHNCRRWQIYNNTAYQVTRFFAQGRDIGTSGTRFWHNAVVAATSAYHSEEPASAERLLALIDEADDNLFFDVGAIASWQYGGSTVDTLDAWRSESAFDQRSIVADPMFVDADGGDFAFRVGSPAIGAGREGADLGANDSVCTAEPPARTDAGPPSLDAGPSGETRDAGTSGRDASAVPGPADGCACRASSGSPLGAMLILAVLLGRRRSRR